MSHGGGESDVLGTAGDGADGLLCREVATDVGLDFRNDYGAVAATTEFGIIMQRNLGNGAAVGDYDNDGDLDVYLLAQRGYPNRLFRNDLDHAEGSASFTDVTDVAGVGDLGLGRVAHFADFDNDGLLDLILFNDYDGEGGVLSPSRLYRNEGDGVFTDRTSGSGLDVVGYIVGGSAVTDYDADGDLDLYVTYWTMELAGSPIGGTIEGAFPGANRLFENRGEFQFTDVTEDAGLAGLAIDSLTPVFADFDRDNDLDLYVAIDHRPDRYYRFDKDGFQDMSVDSFVTHRGNDMGVAVADVDGNGFLDLFVTNIFDPNKSFGVPPEGNTLLLVEPADDEGIRFVDAADDRGVKDTGWAWGTSFVDVDLDGDLDLFAVQGFDEFVGEHFDLFHSRARLLENDGEGYFEAVDGRGCDVGGDQRSLIPFDYDRDGDPDFLITQVGLPVLLLENQTDPQNWLTVALDGSVSDAEVQVVVGGQTLTQVVLAGGSYLAGMPREAYFGLQDAAVAQEVTVQWPSGEGQSFTDIEAGTVLRVAPKNQSGGND